MDSADKYCQLYGKHPQFGWVKVYLDPKATHWLHCEQYIVDGREEEGFYEREEFVMITDQVPLNESVGSAVRAVHPKYGQVTIIEYKRGTEIHQSPQFIIEQHRELGYFDQSVFCKIEQ